MSNSHRLIDLPTKQRDWGMDGLPADDEEWEATPAAVEQAYRRGFMHGAAWVHQALQEGLNVRQIEDWIYHAVHQWRFQNEMRCEVPPDYRDLRQSRSS